MKYGTSELATWSRDLNTYFTLCNCLFGAVKQTKNGDLDKYGYSSYGIGFDTCSQFSWSNHNWGKIVVSFGADMSLSVDVDKKDILVLGEGPTQGFDDTKITEEVKYPINSTQSGKNSR